MHDWEWQGIQLDHFSPREFKHPEMMDRDLLLQVDALRRRCGFALHVTSDGRSEADIEAIYGDDQSEWPGWLREVGSPHQRGHAIDFVPAADDKQTRDERRAKVFSEAFQMWEMGLWPRCGIEFADHHIHVDNDVKLRRPHFWPGESL